MRRSTSFRDMNHHPPLPPSPPKFADSCRVWAPPPPPKGLIYQAKRHRTHPNTYFALKQRKLQLEKSSFRDYHWICLDKPSTLAINHPPWPFHCKLSKKRFAPAFPKESSIIFTFGLDPKFWKMHLSGHVADPNGAQGKEG